MDTLPTKSLEELSDDTLEEKVEEITSSLSLDERMKQMISAALEEKPRTIKELSQKLGFTHPKKVLNLCREYDITLPESFQLDYERASRMSASRREKLEGLVAVGRTLDEMKVHLNVTRERVRQMLQKSGLHSSWKERRKEVKSRKRNYEDTIRAERQRVVDSLRQLEEIVAPQSPWVEVKVWQYRNIRPGKQGNPLPNSSLLKLFEAYAVTRLTGKKLSVSKFGKIAGIKFNGAGRILREVGLDRMYGNIDNRHTTPRWKKEAIFRGFDSPLSVRDIAYFLELPFYVIDQNLRLRGHKSTKKEPILQWSNKVKAVTYRLASQVYEAQDLGFNPQETSELLDLHLKRVTYVQQRRHEYAPIITKTLQKMFSKESINTPYRWKKEVQ